MPNPTRQEIIEAHDAAEKLAKLAARQVSYATDEEIANSWKKQILAALPPKPQPTMAEVEWDDDKHYLAEAEQNIHGKVIMLGLDENGLIEYFVPRLRECRYDAAHRETITPTGKRYTLTEVQE